MGNRVRWFGPRLWGATRSTSHRYEKSYYRPIITIAMSLLTTMRARLRWSFEMLALSIFLRTSTWMNSFRASRMMASCNDVLTKPTTTATSTRYGSATPCSKMREKVLAARNRMQPLSLKAWLLRWILQKASKRINGGRSKGLLGVTHFHFMSDAFMCWTIKVIIPLLRLLG